MDKKQAFEQVMEPVIGRAFQDVYEINVGQYTTKQKEFLDKIVDEFYSIFKKDFTVNRLKELIVEKKDAKSIS